ncbi:MAG: DoxX family membrane protein [Nitrososphaerales archaeon]
MSRKEPLKPFTTIQVSLDNWFVRNLFKIKTALRIVFGIMWGIDGALKFLPGTVDSIVSMINSAGQSQPSWLLPWFNFWSATVASNPSFFVYSTGTFELLISFGLIFGFLRKITYTASFLLGLVIWSVPEGFGGPYGAGSTDIGTGIVYAIVSIFLLLMNGTFGTSRYSLDYYIESKISWWKRLAEIRSV